MPEALAGAVGVPGVGIGCDDAEDVGGCCEEESWDGFVAERLYYGLWSVRSVAVREVRELTGKKFVTEPAATMQKSITIST